MKQRIGQLHKSVEAYMRAQGMLKDNAGIVVGVSGGADSMCLISVLLELKDRYGLRLYVVHVNHGIRGETADRDEEFVRSFCEAHELTFSAVHADVPQKAAAEGLSCEEAGRAVRYESFFRACEKYDCETVAVAHNLEDRAETVLFNLFRGTGLAGIKGIDPVSARGGYRIIRPLLDTSRAQIEQYLRGIGQDWVSDETNKTDDYSRNCIRNSVMPYVREHINSSADEHIATLAQSAVKAQAFIDNTVRERINDLETLEKLRISDGDDRSAEADVNALLTEDEYLREMIIRELVGRTAGSLKDITRTHITAVEGLLQNQGGRRINLPYGLIARISFGRLIIEKGKEKISDETYPELDCMIPGELELPDKKGRLIFTVYDRKNSVSVPKNDYTKIFDYDRIKGRLAVRTRRAGDRLFIRKADGELGSKSLKSYFTDSGTDISQRDRMPLLTEGSHVLWVIGGRRDDSYRVDETTEHILQVELRTYIDQEG